MKLPRNKWDRPETREMTDTEKLGDKFYQIIKEHGKDGKAYQVDLLLQVCKEAGLVFRGKRYNIDLTTILWGIKEIE